MKVRFLTVFVLILSLVLPTLGMPASAAQPQPTGPTTHAQSPAEGPATTLLGTHSDVPGRLTAQHRRETDAPLAPADLAQAREALESAPLMFIENVGQFDEHARFQVRGSNATIYLTDDGIWFTILEKPLRPQTLSPDLQGGGAPLPTPEPQTEIGDKSLSRQGVNLKYTFVGANPDLQLEPFNRLDTVVSYFTGNDPAKWQPSVPVWGGVRYGNLYPGVDLEMTGENGQWVWRLVTHDSTDLEKVRLHVEGADDMTVDSHGRLRMETPVGDVSGPIVTRAHSQVLMRAEIEDDTVKFVPSSRPQPGSKPNASSTEAANCDENQDALVYSTFLGGSNWDAGNAITTGSDGTAYVTGASYSTDYPTTPGAFDTTSNGGYDIFVTELHSTGNALVFSTFLGGSSSDLAYAIALDSTGAVYLVGYSYSSNFPTTTEAHDPTYNGSWDTVVAKLNTSGTALLYSTYLGGSSMDFGDCLAVDSAGAAYVAGETRSSNFPTTPGAFDTTWNGGSPFGDAFVAKLGPAGSDLEYSTFLGGTDEDDANGIAVDSSGAAYVVGWTGDSWTGSNDFPTTTGAFETAFAGLHDVFITKLDASGTSLVYSGLLGGSNDDQGQGIAVDVFGTAYVTGQTNSDNFVVTPGAFDANLSGAWDGFVARLSSAGDALIYSTYLGGNSWDCETVGIDRECVIAADNSGVAYIAGRTFSVDFPTTSEGFDTSYNGNEDGFVVKLDPDGGNLVYGSFFGGTSADQTLAVTVDAGGGASASGRTYSSDFPTTVSAFDRTFNGGVDAFVVKLPVGSGLPPSPQGNLQLHMSDALPPDTPIVPVVTVINVDPVPADFTVIVQLRRGFGLLAEQSQNVSFVSFGRQQITFDFGVYSPDTYHIWAELWRDGEQLEVESHSFSVGLDYLRLRSVAGDLTNAAYAELNDGEDIAIDALSQGTATGTSEAVDFIVGELASRALQLGDIDELLPADVAFASEELVKWGLNFNEAIEQGTYDRIAPYWRNLLDERSFNERRASTNDAEALLLAFAQSQTFTWDPAWQAESVRRQEVIRNKNETVGALSLKEDFEPPFVRRASLVEMKGQFDWLNDEVLPKLGQWSVVVLIGLVLLLVVAAIIVLLPASAAPPVLLAALAIVGKAVLLLFPPFVKLFLLLKKSKLVIAVIILVLGAIGIGATAENIVSPEVVSEHQDAMDYLRASIGGQMTTGPLPSVSVSADTRGHYASLSTQLDAEGNPAWLETQLFRGDGRLLEIVDYGLTNAGVDVNNIWRLPTGPYWAVTVLHGQGAIQVQQTSFQVTLPDVTLDLTLSDNQLNLGEPLEATVKLTNPNAITGTGTLVLNVMTLDGEGHKIWLPKLGPSGSVAYDYSFVPQSEGSYALRAAVGDDLGTIARVDRGFAVGDTFALAINVSPQTSYSPSQNITWAVTAINAGTQPTTTVLVLNTYDRGADYALVYSTAHTLTLDAGASVAFTMTTLPAALPGAYSAHLVLGNHRYCTDDFLVEAEGTLFAITNAEPSALSVSESVTLTVDIQDDTYSPINADVVLNLYAPDGNVLNVPLAQIGNGSYQGVYVANVAGTYAVEMIASKSNYASAASNTFFTADDASLLLLDTHGELALHETRPITLSVYNEYYRPVSDATVIVSGTNGLTTDETDHTGMVNLVLHPVITDTVTVHIAKPGFASTSLHLPVAVVSDTVAPNLSLLLPSLTNEATFAFNGLTEPGITLTVNGERVSVACNGVFTATVKLTEGDNLITGMATDDANNSTLVTKTVTLDTVAPVLTVTWPPNGLLITGTVVTVTGTTDPDASLMINDLLIDVQPDGSFLAWMHVVTPGANTITALAVDRTGNEVTERRVIWRPSKLYLPLVVRK